MPPLRDASASYERMPHTPCGLPGGLSGVRPCATHPGSATPVVKPPTRSAKVRDRPLYARSRPGSLSGCRRTRLDELLYRSLGRRTFRAGTELDPCSRTRIDRTPIEHAHRQFLRGHLNGGQRSPTLPGGIVRTGQAAQLRLTRL